MQVLGFSLFLFIDSLLFLKHISYFCPLQCFESHFLSSPRGWTLPKEWGEQALESFFLPVEVKENLEVILSYNEAGHSPVKLFELMVSYSEVILLVNRLSLT